ncbi:hypothetical protein FBU30_006556 [Linnemannia zychae]|nr:hypothetical protein FBU30_006556 [Linnemannia zychae]
MASSNISASGQRMTLPQRPSELTIRDLDNDNTNYNINNENSPLINKQHPPPNTNQPKMDETALYVKVITEHLPWYKRPSVLWLIPIFGMVWITNGMLTSSQGQFQAALLCREYLNRHTSNYTSSVLAASAKDEVASFFVSTAGSVMATVRPASECEVPEIQAFTAKVFALIEVITGIGSTLSIGYYSSLSDRYGRRIIMIVSFVNTFLVLSSYVLMNIYWDQFGLPLMVLSGLVNGLLGGSTLGATMALAYTADCTDPSKRSLAFSWIHAVLFFGLAIGPFLGGTIVRASKTILTIVFIDMSVTVIAILLTVFVMPESLPSIHPEHLRRLYTTVDSTNKNTHGNAATETSASANTAWHSHLFQSLSFFKPNGRNTNLILLATISFLQMLAYRGTVSVIILYTNQVFHWTEYEDGIMFSLSSTARLLTMLVFLPLLVHFYQKSAAKKQKRLDATTATDATTACAASDFDQRSYSQVASYGSNGSTSNSYDRPPTLHGEDIVDRSDVINNRSSVFNPLDPTVAASLQYLGETALDLGHDGNDSDDSNSDNGDDKYSYGQGSPNDKHCRQTSVDSTATLIPNKAVLLRSSSHLDQDQSNIINSADDDDPSTVHAADSVTPNTRTKEQQFSDMKFDTWMIRLGFAINSITYVGYGLAQDTPQFYLATALHSVSIISSPSLKSLLTTLVEPSQFGAVLGALQVVDSIAAIFSPVVISWVYAMTVGTYPEIVWYSCALWTGICLVLAFMIRQKQFRRHMPNCA